MKSIVIECKLPTVPSRIDEVKSMAEVIGYDVVASVAQRRDYVHHSYCIGPGKLDEIKKLVEEKEVNKVIFTNTLPSSQVFKVRAKIGNNVEVIDRNLLILELFEKRAMTSEAKLQIKLAKLRYTFSWGRGFLRLEGILGEQVGWSGPGDYPFKDYEKAARRRISEIEKALANLRMKKELLRRRRHELGYPIVALAGYTQSGKTTFFNRLASESKSVGLGPFTTLSTCARRVRVDLGSEHSEFIVVDSIGFIEDMHPIIVDAFNTTLNEISNADLIIIFIDSSDNLTTLERKIASTSMVLRRIDAVPSALVCVNKIDLVSNTHLEEIRKIIHKHLPGLDLHEISAKTGENLEELISDIAERIGKTVKRRLGRGNLTR